MSDLLPLNRVQLGWFSRDFWLCTLIMFLVEFGCALLGAASPRLLESVVCREYYRAGGLEHAPDDGEASCKDKDIQIQLGLTLTVLSTLSILAATLMQIPMGWLADKKGRKPALVLNIISTILYWGWIPIVGLIGDLPVWSLYIAPLFILIGGGPWASGALIFAAINRQTSSSHRTPAFSIMEALSGIADLIGPAVGSLTLEEYIWLPFLLATISFSLMFVPTYLLSDTPTELSEEAEIVCQPDDDDDDSTPVSAGGDETAPLILEPGYDSCGRRPSWPLSSSTITICAVAIGSIFLLSAARDANNFLIPWISWRFDISMAHAGFIFSLRAVVSSAVFLVILPASSAVLTNYLEIQPVERDLLLSAGSAGLGMVGSILMAFAPNVWTLVGGFTIMVLGSGASVTLRAFLASKVDRSKSGRLFAVASAASTVGSLVGMPVMGAVYSYGISEDTNEIFWPFIAAGVAYLLVTYVMGMLRGIAR